MTKNKRTKKIEFDFIAEDASINRQLESDEPEYLKRHLETAFTLIKRLAEELSERDQNEPIGKVVTVSTQPINLDTELGLNHVENESFGESMSAEEMKTIFGENSSSKKSLPDFNKMATMEEVENWEKSQDNSNDIYRIKGRIKNHATLGGASVLAAGEGLINSFAHMCKAMYKFAETLKNPEEKQRLHDLIRKQEVVPSQIISTFSPQRKD